MTNPLRKEREDLTTADIARENRQQPSDTSIQEGRPKLAQSERSSGGTAAIAHPGDASRPQAQPAPLFPANELDNLRKNWDRMQTGFVDEPRKAVEEADGLVASTMKRLAEVFAQERSKLEQQWDRGDNVSTEDLRVALQRYRSFFQRLLAI